MKHKSILLTAVLSLAALTASAQAPAKPATIYDRTIRRLDMGGEMLVYLNTEGVASRLMKELGELIAMGGDGDKEARDVLGKADKFMTRVGINDIQALGLSSRARTDGLHDIRVFLARDPAGKGAMWNIMGSAPKPLKGLRYMAENDVVAMACSMDAGAIWQLILDAVADFGGPDATAEMTKGMTAFRQESGIDVEGMVKSVGNEFFITISFSATDLVKLPVDEKGLEIPEPGAVIGLAVKDNQIAAKLAAVLFPEGSTVKEEKVGAVTLRYGAPLQAMPIPMQPTLVEHDGMLMIATTPKAMKAALAAAGGKGRLADTADFKKFGMKMPERCTALTFVSPRLMKTFEKVIAKVAESAPAGEAAMVQAMSSKMTSMMGWGESLTVDSLGEDGYASVSVSSVGARRAILSSGLPMLGMVAAMGIPMAMRQSIPEPAVTVAESDNQAGGEQAAMDILKKVMAAKAAYAAANPGKKLPTLKDLEPFIDGDLDLPEGARLTVNPVGTPAILRMADGAIHTAP